MKIEKVTNEKVEIQTANVKILKWKMKLQKVKIHKVKVKTQKAKVKNQKVTIQKVKKHGILIFLVNIVFI